MQYRIEADTDVGLRRSKNEDFFGILSEAGLVVVCDGMGGHDSGELASRLAVTTIQEAFERLNDNEITKLTDDVEEELPACAERLLSSIRIANFHLRTKAKALRQRTEMGTTVVAALLTDNMLIVAHVGDSRLYRLQDRLLEQLTQDHSAAQEFRLEAQSPKNIITRALGVEDNVDIDILILPAKTNDRFLLSTDGLTGLVSDEQIEEILNENSDDNVAIRRLIDSANAKGGKDNITVALATVTEASANYRLAAAHYLTVAEKVESTTAIKHQLQERLFDPTSTKSRRGLKPKKSLGTNPPLTAAQRKRQQLKKSQYAGLAVLGALAIVSFFIWIAWPSNDSQPSPNTAQLEIPIPDTGKKRELAPRDSFNATIYIESRSVIKESNGDTGKLILIKITSFKISDIENTARVVYDDKDLGRLKQAKIQLLPGVYDFHFNHSGFGQLSKTIAITSNDTIINIDEW